VRDHCEARADAPLRAADDFMAAARTFSRRFNQVKLAGSSKSLPAVFQSSRSLNYGFVTPLAFT